MHTVIEIALVLPLPYAAVGFIFAIVFHVRGLGMVDPAAGRGGWFFRTVITPGIVVLWPLLAHRWMAAYRMPAYRYPGSVHEAKPFISPEALSRLHQRAWWVIGLAAPIILAAALVFRPSEGSLPELPPVLSPAAHR